MQEVWKGVRWKGQRVSHLRSCTGGAYNSEGDMRQCVGCERWASQAN